MSEYEYERGHGQIKKWRVAAAERLRNAKKWCVGFCVVTLCPVAQNSNMEKKN